MPDTPPLSRRRLLHLTGVAGLAATASWLGAPGAGAADGFRTTVTDLGPGIEQFSLMSGLLVGDTVYIGSRNLSPCRVIGFHLPSRKVVARTDLVSGFSIQALAADPTGRYLYIGVLSKGEPGKPTLYEWDLTTPEKPAVGIGTGEDQYIRDLTVAPDGVVYAAGGKGGGCPLWEYDRRTGNLVNKGVPDPNAMLARAVAATDSTVYFGAGSVLSGGGDASRASLYAFDRASGVFTSIIPEGLAEDPSLRDLALFGDHLLIGTSGSTDPAKLAVMKLSDPSSCTVVPTTGAMVKTLTGGGDHVYFANDAGLQSYSLTSGKLAPVEHDGPALGEIWGVDHRDGKLIVVSAFGFVAEIALDSGACTVTELAAAGAPVGPQLGMGVAVGGGYAYLGGNAAIARHDLTTGKVLNLRAPGEAKDAEVVDGVLYTGQYSGQGIWTYDPASGEGPRQAADFPSAQNRPVDTCWDPVNKLFLVGVQADSEGAGSFWTYSPATGKTTMHVNPIDDVQLVRAVTAADGVAYLGGDNALATGPRATILAWDPVAGRELWRLDTALPRGIAAMVAFGPRLYGLTHRGGLFVVDLRTRELIHTRDLRHLCPGFSAMLTARGTLYAVSDTTLFRVDPKTFAVTTVVPGINGKWYSGPHVNADEEGRLYTLRGHRLVQVDDRPGG